MLLFLPGPRALNGEAVAQLERLKREHAKAGSTRAKTIREEAMFLEVAGAS